MGFECDRCKKLFTRIDNLKRHQQKCFGGEEHSNLEISEMDQNNFKFKHPFTMTIAAPTGFGKTYWVKTLLESKDKIIDPQVERIVWCFGQWQPIYDTLKRSIRNIEFVDGLPPDIDTYFNSKVKSLLILDDLMDDISKNKQITQLYTRGSHHLNLSVICLMQNFFYKNTQTLRRNSHYLVLFDMPADKTQINTMSRQMFPTNPHSMLKAYEKAISQPYGHLIIVLKPNTPTNEKLRSNIFEETCKEKPEQRTFNTNSNADELNKTEDAVQVPDAYKDVYVNGIRHKMLPYSEYECLFPKDIYKQAQSVSSHSETNSVTDSMICKKCKLWSPSKDKLDDHPCM